MTIFKLCIIVFIQIPWNFPRSIHLIQFVSILSIFHTFILLSPLRYSTNKLLSPLFQLAAKIVESVQRPPHRPYANNWVERLRHIRRIKENVMANIRKSDEKYGAPKLDDFADLIDVTVRNREPDKPGKYSIQLMY